MRRNILVLFLLSVFLYAPAIHAQFSVVPCTNGETGTCRQVATCNQSDIMAAIGASAASLSGGYVSPSSFTGDGVYVPAGSCSWSSPVGWSNKNINLIGNNPTISHSSDAFDVTTTTSGAHGAAFHISGFNFTGSTSGHLMLLQAGSVGSGVTPTIGVAWAGYYRFDHVTYNYSSSGNVFQFYGVTFGLYDHVNGTTSSNHFEQSNGLDSEYDDTHGGSPTNVQLQGEYGGRIVPSGLGTEDATYIEDSTFSCPGNYSGAISDSESGGQKMVFRHNILSGTCFHYSHWTRDTEWDGDTYEIYNNVYNGGVNGQFPMRFGSGTGVIFNNSFTNYSDLRVFVDETRGAGGETPNGPFFSCDGTQPIDGNAGDAGAPGWPCAGQIGFSCKNGNCARGALNSVPLLLWNNGTQPGCATGGTCTDSLSINVDGCQGTYNLTPINYCTRTMTNYIKTTPHSVSGPLNGAKDYCLGGSSEPPTCGIATITYIPFIYPHPLQGSGVTNFTWVPTAINGSISGSNSAVGNYPSGTTIGPITATANTGYGFASWSGASGSAACSGATNPCPSFSLLSNSSVTANFTANSYTLSTAIAGTGSGTISSCAGSHNFATSYTCSISPSAGSIIASVIGCGGSGTTSYTGTMPAGPCTVTATFTGTAATPTFSPVAGSYGSAQTITISTTTPSSTIHYTTDGSTPTTSSTVYTTPVSVSVNTIVKAIAVSSGYTNSAVGSASYIINGLAATPTFSPPAGSYGPTQNVTISSTTPSSTIYYTTDGSTPTTSSTVYTTPISVASSQTVKAIAVASGYINSAIGSAVYVINGLAATPTFSPVAGTYTATQSVTLSSSTTGSIIYYTTNGTTPTTSSTQYTVPVSVSSSQTIKAIAVAPSYSQSSIGSSAYIIQTPVSTPTFSPVAGTYGSSQTVTISTTTPSSTIHYTTDGSTPTTSSPVYSTALTIASTTTVKALATAAGFTTSLIGTSLYTINSVPQPPTVIGGITLAGGSTFHN